MGRGKTKRFSINYEKIFGKPITSRPIRIKPIKLQKENGKK
jgi:hypothetical protein